MVNIIRISAQMSFNPITLKTMDSVTRYVKPYFLPGLPGLKRKPVLWAM